MLNNIFYQIFLSLSPVSENRGALIYGFVGGQNILYNYLISTIPIMCLIPVLLWFWDKTSIAPFVHAFFEKRTKKAVKRIEKLAEKYGYLALLIFVSIPLPVTGVYTGSFVSRVLEMDKKKSGLCLLGGLLVSSIIVIVLKEIFNITIKTVLI